MALGRLPLFEGKVLQGKRILSIVLKCSTGNGRTIQNYQRESKI